MCIYVWGVVKSKKQTGGSYLSLWLAHIKIAVVRRREPRRANGCHDHCGSFNTNFNRTVSPSDHNTHCEDKLLQKTPTTFIIKRAVDVLSFLTQQDHKPSNSQSSIWKYCVIMSIATHGARHGDEKTHVGTCIT